MPPFSSYFWSTPSSTPPARVGFARRAHLDWRSTRIWIGGQRAQYQWYGGPTQIGGSHQLRSRAFCRQICRQSQSRPFSPEIGLCRFWIPIATGIRMRQVGKSSEAHIGCGRSAGLSAQVAVEYGGLQPHQRLSNLGMPSTSQLIAPRVVDKTNILPLHLQFESSLATISPLDSRNAHVACSQRVLQDPWIFALERWHEPLQVESTPMRHGISMLCILVVCIAVQSPSIVPCSFRNCSNAMSHPFVRHPIIGEKEFIASCPLCGTIDKIGRASCRERV